LFSDYRPQTDRQTERDVHTETGSFSLKFFLFSSFYSLFPITFYRVVSNLSSKKHSIFGFSPELDCSIKENLKWKTKWGKKWDTVSWKWKWKNNQTVTDRQTDGRAIR